MEERRERWDDMPVLDGRDERPAEREPGLGLAQSRSKTATA
jgi:hypothetical protein